MLTVDSEEEAASRNNEKLVETRTEKREESKITEIVSTQIIKTENQEETETEDIKTENQEDTKTENQEDIKTRCRGGKEKNRTVETNGETSSRRTFDCFINSSAPSSTLTFYLEVMLSFTVFTLCVWWSIPFVIICYSEVAESWTPTNLPKIPIVIIGGYGDLAKKYLWQGVYNLDEKYDGSPKSPLLMYSSGRAAPEVGEKKTASALTSGVFCAAGDEVCSAKKSSFVERVVYRQLKTEDHFRNLCSDISATTGGSEQGRIFYLSVPPFTYPEIVQFIDLYCRPPAPSESSSSDSPPPPPWLRVVVEKPFGNNLESAQLMSKKLLEYLKDEELYRIDHYLGKTTVRNILGFRQMNRGVGIERILNREHVDKVEVVVKETDGCKGRMNYYDEYGVVADMLQNHLTEVALMVAMDLPTDFSDAEAIESKKLDALATVRPLDASSTVLGQYASYNLEATQELSAPSSRSPSDVTAPQRRASFTPTFAATVLHFDNQRWLGVPFILMTGKKLDERIGYVRISFKDNLFCVPANDADDVGEEEQRCHRRELIFHIAHGVLKRPSILASRSLPRPLPLEGWRETTNQGGNLVFGGNKGHDFYVFSAVEDEIAYSFLIRAVVTGQRDYFLSDEHLMASWKVWSPLLDDLQNVKPKTYSHQKSHLQNLQFLYARKGTLRFILNSDGRDHEFEKYSKAANEKNAHYVTLINASLVLETPTSLTLSLSSRVLSLALRRVSSVDGVFNLALPGGSSPVPLLRQLIAMDDFPWTKTHVWMVDERIVDFSSPYSNFGGVVEILKAASIPYFNLHPIPAHLHSGIEIKKIAELYENEIKDIVEDLRFDCVILGLGMDGHVASLFPEDLNIESEKGDISIRNGEDNADKNEQNTLPVTSSGDNVVVTFYRGTSVESMQRRISMNYKLINGASQIFVVAQGENKRNIIDRLRKEGGRTEWLPIDLIEKSKMTFFVDDAAWK